MNLPILQIRLIKESVLIKLITKIAGFLMKTGYFKNNGGRSRTRTCEGVAS